MEQEGSLASCSVGRSNLALFPALLGENHFIPSPGEWLAATGKFDQEIAENQHTKTIPYQGEIGRDKQ